MPATPTPLLPAPLELELLQLYDDMMQQTDAAAGRAYYCSQLASIITAQIKRAVVQVNTTGTAAAQAGLGTVL
jgi:hypothetical protein